MNNYAYLAAGIAIGVAVVFYQVDTPRADRCETYKVAAKVATAFVLKPPPAEVVYKACPQVTKVEPAPEPEVVKQEEPAPRRRKRWRHRRHW